MSYKMPHQITNIELACSAFGYGFELIDKHSGYLCKVSKEENFVYFGASFMNSYPINGVTAFYISLDKAFTQAILETTGINTPKGDYFFITDELSGLRNRGWICNKKLNKRLSAF